jgi:2-keto-4-pentenoate hydratase
MELDAHTNEIDDLAGQLAAAYRSNKPVPRLTASHPSLTVEQAYAVQLRQVEKWTTAGRRVCGHKVGLTAAVMQRQFGVDQPDFGHLTDDMFYPESTPIRPDAFLSPRVEPEIAFLLGKDLRGPGVTTARAIQAVDAVVPALEIIDSRIENWDITLADTIADNASSGGVVLGSRAIALRDVDTRLTGCVLYRDGAIAATGAGAAALGSPLNALVWLANTLGALGTALEAGSVVLSGSITSAIPIAPGQSVTAVFHQLGSVTATLAAQEGNTQ